jgi:ribose transport system substrate-binding protein/ribose transport system permease protein
MKRFLSKHSPMVILAVLCIVLAVVSSDFRKPGNLKQVAYRTPVFGIMASGQTLVILTGGIDLSVGSVGALGSTTAARIMKETTDRGLGAGTAITLGILAGLGAAVLCGTISGALVAYGRIPPFIATLGVMMGARGATHLVSGGHNIGGLPAEFAYLGGTRGWWIPVSIMLAVMAALTVVLVATRLGRSVYATGGNNESARLSGISVDKVKMFVYIMCALLAGFAGIVESSRSSIAQTTACEGYELEAIAACVIGGTSLMGGEGTVIGAVAGALIMQVLVNFCNLVNISPYWQKILVGALVVALVLYDTYRKRRAGLLRE